jgi:hypothetical protein
MVNPRTGHVLPQFHVVYDDDFTAVSYLWTATVPPHWAELVSLLTAIPIYTEKQVGTWQLIPDNQAEDGDFSGQTKLSTAFNQAQEGVKHRVTFADDFVQNDMKINLKSTQDVWQMPMPFNLDSSGLCCSSRTLVLNRHNDVYYHVTQMIQENMLPACLSLCLATPTLPVALDSSASSILPVGLDLSASSITSAVIDPSANPLLSVTLDMRSARPSNLSAGFGLHSTSQKNSIAALALFSSICSHGHGYSFFSGETFRCDTFYIFKGCWRLPSREYTLWWNN